MFTFLNPKTLNWEEIFWICGLSAVLLLIGFNFAAFIKVWIVMLLLALFIELPHIIALALTLICVRFFNWIERIAV
jgi:hypothetical protein